MQNPRLASRYAKSLLDLAIEQNSLEAVLQDMQLLDKICRQNPDFDSMLRSPVIHADKKLSVLNAILGGHLSALTQAFVKLLVTKGREMNMAEIAQAFIARYKEMKNIKTVKITTATAIDDTVKNNIIAKINAGANYSSIDVDIHVNPDLIGGFMLEMDNKLIDASVRRDLNNIKAKFTDSSYVSKL